MFFKNRLLCQGHYFSKLVRLLNFFCFMATKNHSRRISWRLVIWNTHLYIPNQAMIIMFPSRPYSEVRVRNLYNLRSGIHVRERKKYVWRVKLKSVMGSFFSLFLSRCGYECVSNFHKRGMYNIGVHIDSNSRIVMRKIYWIGMYGFVLD